jgi:hypothetical protein
MMLMSCSPAKLQLGVQQLTLQLRAAALHLLMSPWQTQIALLQQQAR